jgi:hypothetical protein
MPPPSPDVRRRGLRWRMATYNCQGRCCLNLVGSERTAVEELFSCAEKVLNTQSSCVMPIVFMDANARVGSGGGLAQPGKVVSPLGAQIESWSGQKLRDTRNCTDRTLMNTWWRSVSGSTWSNVSSSTSLDYMAVLSSFHFRVWYMSVQYSLFDGMELQLGSPYS